jgi:hypothetical protein
VCILGGPARRVAAVIAHSTPAGHTQDAARGWADRVDTVSASMADRPAAALQRWFGLPTGE